MISRILSIFIVCFAFDFAQAAIPNVSVLLAKNQEKLLVQGLDMNKTLFQSGQKKSYPGKSKILFNCQMETKTRSPSDPVLIASITSPTGIISFQDQKYLGELSIVAAEDSRGCNLIHKISIDRYISSLLAKEMNAAWPIEALKAQAVAARSYALDKIGTKQVSTSKGFNVFYDLENSEKHQVNGSFFDKTPQTDLAAQETSGEILIGPKGEMVPIFFHAKCGGHTLLPSEVWSEPVDGYVSVDCPYCHKSGTKDWSINLTHGQIKKLLASASKADPALPQQIKTNLKLAPDKNSFSKIRFYNGDEPFLLKKNYFRRFLGRQLIPSNNFKLEMKKDFKLSGSGLGHGVGLCQIGALEMAKRGLTYKQILAHYFPKFKISKVY